MPATVVVAIKDLLFGSKVHEAAKRTGVPVQWASRFEKLRDEARKKAADVVIVDLLEPGILAEIAAIRAEKPTTRFVGFLGHERTDVADEAHALGVADVYTRGQFAKQVDAILRDAHGT